jgi:hypothetical protein
MSHCSICQVVYDPDYEGMVGAIGMVPIGFCQTCNAGIVDYVFQQYGADDTDTVGPNVAVVPLEFLAGKDIDVAFTREPEKMN